MKKKVDIIKKLLNSKADDYNKTPLHCATYSRNLEIVKLLIFYNANINTLQCFNSTPLNFMLKWHCNLDITNELLLYGANINIIWNGECFNDYSGICNLNIKIYTVNIFNNAFFKNQNIFM